ncbi:MAG TPA: FAD-dependent monooxygenase [Chloroflexaceae bacterium]|nr:FAD-dependent monooxygenase [Chloroflexaceae bacterium]
MVGTTGARRALVIGGGIGGLATAVALRQIGWEATVFERAGELREVGAGLGIWANAMRALERLGLAAQIRATRPPAPSGGVYDWRGRPIMVESHEALEGRVGEISVVLHRAELLELLLGALGAEHVRLGSHCALVSQDETGVTASFADGSRADGDLLVGADGIRSAVRARLVGDGEPVYAGYVAYRGVVRFDPARIAAGEYWGPGLRFGAAPMSGGRVYWWATRNAPAGERMAPREAHVLLRERFAGWAEPIPALIAATPPEAVLLNEIADRRPLRRWSRGRITLLGDAAHPTTPNLGQGACQALEDAVALADALAGQDDIPAALLAYERRRIPRTTQIVLQSRRIGQLGQWSHPLACAARDALLRALVAPRQAAAIDPVVGYRI